MCKFNFRLLVALLTFGIGALAVHLWVESTHPVTSSIVDLSVQPIVESDSLIVKEGPDNSETDYSQTNTRSSKAIDPDADGSLFQLLTKSKYKHPAITDGLYYGDNELALVLSFNDKRIPPKANDPDAPTVPGFYDSENQMFNFLRVEVIGKKVYFKTISVDGISYEFIGTTGKEFDPEFTDPIYFIKGTLIKSKLGKAVSKEKVEFGHAVIY